MLRKLKAAIRANNAEEVIRCLDEFYSMGGTEKSLNSSLRSLEPLSGLNSKKKREFRNWLPKDETALLDNAETYYKGLRDFYRKATKGYKHAQKERQAQKARQENFKN